MFHGAIANFRLGRVPTVTRWSNIETVTPETAAHGSTCSDGIDNDGDGLADGEDPGCDADGDGVLEGDLCPDTVIPEAVPTKKLGVNRWALTDADAIFDTKAPQGNGPGKTFTLLDTRGCSCEQIIEQQGLGQGHTMHGCSSGALEDFIATITP